MSDKERSAPCQGDANVSPSLLLDNNNSTCKYLNVSILDVLNWMQSQNCIPIPCQTRKKKPILDICEHKILDSGFEYGLFDDSYHVASPDRIEWISRYWKRYLDMVEMDPQFVNEMNPTKMSVAFNTGNGWNNNQYLCVVDVDDKKYMNDFNVDLFKDCPRVYGCNGVKILFFSKGKSIQGTISCGDNHIIDLFFAAKKLIFIYGEHPNSTPMSHICYTIDELKPIPILDRDVVVKWITRYVRGKGLNLRMKDETDSTIIKQPPKVNRMGNSKPSLSKMSNIRLSDVIPFTGVRIPHPVHGSTTGSNLSLNLKDDTWYCHRCSSGGGVLELIAVVEGIIDCRDASRNLFNFKSQKNIDKWIKLKNILESKYGVDVVKYEVDVKQWYKDNKIKHTDNIREKLKRGGWIK